MKNVRIIVISLLLLGAWVNRAGATNLRGRIVHYDPYSRNLYPMPNIRVDLYVFNGGWVDIGYAFSGPDGMYYFNNVAPGANFLIQVNGVFYPPQPLFLANVPLLDIPQLNL
jgi:hypothetical protein